MPASTANQKNELLDDEQRTGSVRVRRARPVWSATLAITTGFERVRPEVRPRTSSAA